MYRRARQVCHLIYFHPSLDRPFFSELFHLRRRTVTISESESQHKTSLIMIKINNFYFLLGRLRLRCWLPSESFSFQNFTFFFRRDEKRKIMFYWQHQLVSLHFIIIILELASAIAEEATEWIYFFSGKNDFFSQKKKDRNDADKSNFNFNILYRSQFTAWGIYTRRGRRTKTAGEEDLVRRCCTCVDNVFTLFFRRNPRTITAQRRVESMTRIIHPWNRSAQCVVQTM